MRILNFMLIGIQYKLKVLVCTCFRPPRMMGEGFVIMQSTELKVHFYMDQPGRELLTCLLFYCVYLKLWDRMKTDIK